MRPERSQLHSAVRGRRHHQSNGGAEVSMQAVKTEDRVPDMPAGVHIKQEDAVPPMPIDAVIVKEEGT